MKLLANKTFPHPVLWSANNDYKARQFQAMRSVSIGAENAPVLTFDFAVSKGSITKFIDNQQASYCIEVLCPATFVRRAFATNLAQGKFTLQKGDLYRRVEINAFIVCTKSIPNYHSKQFNDEFGNLSFDLQPGDVLAAADPKFCYWDTECVAPLHSVFEIVANKTINPGTFSIDTDGDHVKIQMCPADKSQFEFMRSTSEHKPVAMFLYFSVVAEVLRQMKESNDDGGEDKKWYRAIEHQLREKGKSVASLDPFKEAQELLGNPLGLVLPKQNLVD